MQQPGVAPPPPAAQPPAGRPAPGRPEAERAGAERQGAERAGEGRADAGGADAGGAGENPPGAAAPAEAPVENPEALFRHGGGRVDIGGNRVDGAGAGGDVVGGDKHTHIYHSPTAPRVRPGRLDRSALEAVSALYVPGPDHREALERLREERVLVLTGRPGSGRYTAAQQLLHQVSGPDGAVFLLDTGTGFDDIATDGARNSAYLLHDATDGADGADGTGEGAGGGLPGRLRGRGALGAHRLNILRGRLAETGCWLIVTADAGAVPAGARPVFWQPPEPADVLAGHLRRALGREADDRTVRSLAGLEQTAEFIAGRPSMEQIGEFAGILAAHHRGLVTAGELAGHNHAVVAARAAEALADPARGLRDKAFLVSLAVFDRTPYPQVHAHGDELCRLLTASESPEGGAGLPVFGRSKPDLLAWARAVEENGLEETEFGLLPGTSVRFESVLMADSVLTGLWLEHPAARPALLEWLNGLSRADSVLPRVRAAIATGVLAAVDFPGVVGELVRPWSGGRSLRLRQSAAWALHVAAQEGRQRVVLELLRRWSDPAAEGSVARRWTAARAWATLGVDHAARALRNLRATARSDDDGLRSAVVDALASLVRSGAAAEVLAELDEWLHGTDPHLRRTAAEAFTAMAVEWDRGGEDTGPWPLLLRLQEAERSRTGSAGDLGGTGDPGDAGRLVRGLWRAVLRDRGHGRRAGEVLQEWIRGAEDDPQLRSAMTGLLPALVQDVNDRDRLDHLLRHATGSPDDPPAAVRELRQALWYGKSRGAENNR
ncbi:HEAT repeat domain-containing protein [Streptomyces sp. HB2AG]|uniref:HEAT repeat domain-containing protein n=1 Tax=Streptomyces sp. HB2AG TaxID=2983400 RepID=UPI0022AB4E1C|nr:HEAT repeat domain-containing protein [Streptomyces sp. HB2AG]MCZ2523261.1 HEAT repeat domain-containing protein [Streptomyces sp. HB2AG]